MTEAEILKRVEELDQQLVQVRQRVSVLKKQLTDEETTLIGYKLERAKLSEELRVYRKTHYSPEITDRQQDIERFKKVLPDLIKKIG